MDAVSLVVTIVGTIASFAGAVFSWFQAKASQTAAKEAQNAKRQLIEHRVLTDIAQIQSSCRKAQKSMEKYGPGSTPESLSGVSPENDAKDVQEFVLLIREHRTFFEEESTNQADAFSDSIWPLIDSFATAGDPTLMRRYGSQIVVALSNMASIIKTQVDTRRESYG
ncbi:hypothetical protein GC175_33780 [bacterium]|nr:hypothetical protein [bacterium]